MNKKAVLGISIIVGGVMMATAALASASGSSGYETYKSAFKNTRAVASMTGTAEITVADNGNVILKSEHSIKMNRDTGNMSGSVDLTAGDQVKSMTMYRQNGQTITKSDDSQVYNVLPTERGNFHHSEKWDQGQKNPALAKDVENIVDLVVGNYQDYISLDSKADGSKEVSLELSGSQISPIANAVTSLVVREGALEHGNKQHSASSVKSAIGDQIPKLVDEIRVTNIDVKADIDNQNLIKEQTANVTITGIDADGINHEVVVTVDVNLSDFNNTTPDSVDLTGKQVKTIQPEEMERFSHHG